MNTESTMCEITTTSVKVIIKVGGKPVTCIPTAVLPDGTVFARANDCPEYPDEGTLYMLQSSVIVARTVSY